LKKEEDFEEMISKIINILKEFKEYTDNVLNNKVKGDIYILNLLNECFHVLKNESPILYENILKQHENDLKNILELNKTLENQVLASEKIYSTSLYFCFFLK
jgi:hypothetical protein